MDISFQTNHNKFNYRVCAVIIHNDQILAMRDDDRAPYYYLPGGRVLFGERAEDAVVRELQEELKINAKIIRPLWLNQAFFTEDVTKNNFHELCIYFLIDFADTDLLERGQRFIMTENERTHVFEWLSFDGLENEYLYPLFIKKEIFHLPDGLVIRTEMQ